MTYAISLGGTILVYTACRHVYAKCHRFILHPTLVSFAVLVCLLCLTRFPYPTYTVDTRWLSAFRGPAIVSLAFPLKRNFTLLKQHAVEIMSGPFLGTVVAVTTSVLFAQALDLNRVIDLSVAARSVTTPIAMEISQVLGGVPALTAVFTLTTALFGAILGPLLIRGLRIRSPMAKGMLLGMGCHGLGTSLAFQLGQTEGAFATISMIVAAGLTVVLAPILTHLMV